MTNHKTWHRWAVAIVACWLGLGTALAAEPDWENATAQLRMLALPGKAVDSLIAQARQRGLKPSTMLEWRVTLAQAQQAGIPPALLGERIAQGLAKGVPADRISQSLGSLHSNLVWAKQGVEAHVAKAELRTKPAALEQALRQTETALRAGLERGQLEQIFDDTKLTLEQFTALARAAANLRGFGAEPAQVVRALQLAGHAGLTAAEINRLERKLTKDQSAGRALPDLLMEFEQGAKALRDPLLPDRDELRQEIKHDSTQDWRGAPSGGGPTQEIGNPYGGIPMGY